MKQETQMASLVQKYLESEEAHSGCRHYVTRSSILVSTCAAVICDVMRALEKMFLLVPLNDLFNN